MCLYLQPLRASREILQKEKRRISSYKRPFKAWKVVSGSNHGIFFSHTFKLGLNKSDRKEKELDWDEKHYQEIHHGFHVFLRKQDALKSLDRLAPHLDQKKLIEVWIHPRDVVGVGVFMMVPCLVASKLTIRKQEGVI